MIANRERDRRGERERNTERKRPGLEWLSGLSASLQTKRLPVQFSVRAHAWV